MLRVRLGLADAVDDDLHDFKVLMEDRKDVIADQWYWQAFEELEAQGHLHPASTVLNGGSACARLSADGRLYLRQAESD